MSPVGSALLRQREPDVSAWTLNEHLLATIVDAVHVANWQRAGGKKKDRPRPIPRPGIGPEKTVITGTPVSIDEMNTWLDWNTPTVTASDL